jgi:hypothetical protein
MLTTLPSHDPSVVILSIKKPSAFSWPQLRDLEFTLKTGYTSSWTTKEEKLVSDFMKRFLKDPTQIEYPDYFLYISRKVLDGSKSRQEVKQYLIQYLHK